MLRRFRLRSTTIIPTSSSSCVLSLFPSPSSFHRRDLHIETKVFSPSGIEWVSITSSEDLSEIVKEVSPPITKNNNKNTNNDTSDKNIKSGHDDIKSKNEEKSSSTTKNSENSNNSTSSSDNTKEKSKSSEKTTTTTTTSISKSESNSSYASSEFIKENKHMKKQFEFESMFHSHHFYGQEQNSPEHVEAKKKKQQKKTATKSSNDKKDDKNEEIQETEKKNKSSNDESKTTTTTSEKNETGKQSETKETENNTNKKNKDDKKPSSSPSFNYGRHDAPSCPVRRSDYEFQTELAFALRQLNVPDYFIFRMRKRIPLPLIMYHPLADDSTAGCVFVCRYFQHHRIASGERELSESEMLTQMKKNVARRQYEATKRRRLWYRNPVLSRIAETLDSSHVISRTCYNLSRRAYWRWLKMKILRNAPPLTDNSNSNSNDATSNENDNNDATKDTIKQGDSSTKKDESKKANKSTKKKEENDKNNKNNNKQASYLFGDVDTIESSTHRLTIIVQPERIITVSRFPINFISEMERSFDRLNRHEPPMHFICSLVSQCSATFEKAARTELRFVDHLESIFFEQQTERERTDTYKMMLYQLHKVSRRASISANILPQMISAFTELCAALQHSQQQQQHQQQLAVIRGAEDNNFKGTNEGEEDNVDDESSSSTADDEQPVEDQALTPQQIIASNRQVLNCISHMRNALALHADVYESCRVVMALFFQESANELEKLTRTLTVFSTLFIPMSFMTTLFSADFEVFKPLYSSGSYFWLTLAGIFVVGLSTNAWLIATGVLRR